MTYHSMPCNSFYYISFDTIYDLRSHIIHPATDSTIHINRHIPLSIRLSMKPSIHPPIHSLFIDIPLLILWIFVILVPSMLSYAVLAVLCSVLCILKSLNDGHFVFSWSFPQSYWLMTAFPFIGQYRQKWMISTSVAVYSDATIESWSRF